MSSTPPDTQIQFIRNPLEEISHSNKIPTSNAILSATGSSFRKQSSHTPENKNIHQFHQQSSGIKKEDLKVIKILPKQKREQEEQVEDKQNHDRESSFHQLDKSHEHALIKYNTIQENVQKIDVGKSQIKIFLKKFIDNPKRFLTEKLRQNQLARLKITRKSSLWENTIITFLERNSGQSEIVEFKRQFKLFGTKAIIKLNQGQNLQFSHQQSQKPANNEIGWIQSNLNGSIFNVYQRGTFGELDKHVATINYADPTECMGGPRKVKIFINNRQNTSFHPGQQIDLKAEFEADPNTQNICYIQSLSPSYNQQTKTYNISFKTIQPPKPSTHNIVFINNLSKAGLKFYKVQDKQYFVECFSSVTPLIALSYSFSSFAFKLTTQ